MKNFQQTPKQRRANLAGQKARLALAVPRVDMQQREVMSRHPLYGWREAKLTWVPAYGQKRR